jgi:alanyl-tRNA synthetase
MSSRMTEKCYLRAPLCDGTMILSELRCGPSPVARFVSTYFHPKGGGQPADLGTIDGIQVLAVLHAEDGTVDHHLASVDNLEVGGTYVFQIDRENRAINARYHSAGHLIGSICEDMFDGVSATSGHQWPGEARVEFSGDNLERILPELRHIESRFNEIASSALDVAIIGDPYATRAIQIGSYNPIPCGGTHVQITSEIGRVVLRSAKVKKAMLRIGYALES